MDTAADKGEIVVKGKFQPGDPFKPDLAHF